MNELRSITYIKHEEREPEVRPLDLGLIRRLFGRMRACLPLRNRLLVLVVVRAIQLPFLAWSIGAIIGGPISRLDLPGILLGAAGFAGLAALTQYTLHYRSLFGLQIGEKIVFDLRHDMFVHLQRLCMKFFHTTKIGRIISRFTTDTESMRTGVQNVLFMSMVNLGQMIIAAVLMLVYDRFLFSLMAGLVPIFWFLNRYYHGRLSRAYRDMQESFSRISSALVESINGIRVTQSFSRETVNAGLFRALAADHARYNLKAARTSGVFLPLIELNMQLFTALILLVGGWRVMHGHMQIEALYQFLLLTHVFLGPVQTLGQQYDAALSAMAGAERVFRFLDRKPDWEDPPDAVALPDLSGKVEFERVTFGYDEQRPVLHDISFTADPGKILALVGHTGSGKSSIINLISKFYLPTSGRVLIDNVDIRNLDSRALHRRMGIVLQQNFLFTGTILDNIRVGKPDATLEEASAAARNLDCLDMIESLPDGFMTRIGRDGAGVSLGQRQLICFVRAMVANPRILILDEATSAVDTMTEARIQKALSLLLKNRTSIVVAHRLSTVRFADSILVLDNGRIAERGSHRDLLLARGAYARLYRQLLRSARR